jgi:hypothetical protein
VTKDDTFHQRPLPRRPETGLQAWQATIGYLRQRGDNPALAITAYPASGTAVAWSAALHWSRKKQEVQQAESLAAALRRLWAEVDARYTIFDTPQAATRRPAGYSDAEWLDAPTLAALERLLLAAHLTFATDWQVALVYQPMDNPEERVQASLTAHGGAIRVDGWGPSVREACQRVYRSAARYFAARSR